MLLLQQGGPSKGQLLELEPAAKDATPKRGVKKEVAAVHVGSLEAGPLSACASDFWILSVEVAEIDESSNHTQRRLGDGGQWRRRLSLPSRLLARVRGQAWFIEHIGQKTFGYATRDGANVEIACEAAKVRRPLLSVDSLVERGHVAVCTGSGGFFISRSALQVDPAVREAEHDATELTFLASSRSTH